MTNNVDNNNAEQESKVSQNLIFSDAFHIEEIKEDAIALKQQGHQNI